MNHCDISYSNSFYWEKLTKLLIKINIYIYYFNINKSSLIILICTLIVHVNNDYFYVIFIKIVCDIFVILSLLCQCHLLYFSFIQHKSIWLIINVKFFTHVFYHIHVSTSIFFNIYNLISKKVHVKVFEITF